MNPTHHLEHSQRYLNFAALDAAAGDYCQAARALARAASHAVTAAAIHWHHPHYSRRSLTSALGALVYDRLLAYTHRRTFREVYQLPGQLAAAAAGDDAGAARRLLRRCRRRVGRLLAAVQLAMSRHPSPTTMDEIRARLAAAPEPEPIPVWTVTQAEQVLGSYYRPEYAAQLAPS